MTRPVPLPVATDCPECLGGLTLVGPLRDVAGVDAVATLHPDPRSPYHQRGFVCPGCGRVWYVYPTAAQVTAWGEAGVA
jgi:hypothetical protein